MLFAEKGERPVYCRPEDQTYMELALEQARLAAKLGEVPVGAVIVQDKHIIATGYNGAPRGIEHCGEREGGCLREQLGVPSGEKHELCRALHAEQNAIIQAATLGQSVEGATIYVTHQPCVICAKMIINAGIQRIVVKDGYPDELAVDILKEAGLRIVMLGDTN
jgi:dCMP deaminase